MTFDQDRIFRQTVKIGGVGSIFERKSSLSGLIRLNCLPYYRIFIFLTKSLQRDLQNTEKQTYKHII